MAKTTGQRRRLLALARYLLEDTDQGHPLSMARVIERLKAEEIPSERKGLYGDIEALREAGLDVQYRGGAEGGWFIGGRQFQLAEVKMLVDVVESSRFLSRKKSEELISKLSSLISRHEAKDLQRQVYVQGRVKTMNESIYYNVDKIQEVIAANQVMSFLYFSYDRKKEKLLRRGGQRYIVSPKGLIWDRENYYLAGFDHKHMELRHYRVDKMLDIDREGLMQLGEQGGAWFDTASYSQKHFSMFGGKESFVTLRCHEALAGVILDRFGMEVSLVPDGDAHFTVTLEVVVSPQFWGWLFGLGDGAALTAPFWAVQAYRQRLKDLLSANGGT